MATTQKAEDAIGGAVQSAVTSVAKTRPIQELISRYKDLTPEQQRNTVAGLEVAEGVGTMLGAGPAIKVFKKAATEGTKVAGEGLNAGATVAKDVAGATGKAVDVVMPVAKGTLQVAKDVAGRVPRAVLRGSEALDEAATRGARMKTATPALRQAIASKLDDKIINTIEDVKRSSPDSIPDYRRMIDIAESSQDSPTARMTPVERPSIVAGESAARQFDLLESERRRIGSEIGVYADSLGAGQVPMGNAYQRLETVLRANRISMLEDGKLDFSRSGLSRAQRTKVQELYDLSTEGGDSLTAREIYGKDQLFSQLQRETRMDGVGDVRVNVPGKDGTQSLFSVFRDVYSSTLDEAVPSNIRELNGKYRTIVTQIDDIESSIFRTPNFDVVRTTDPAEFAKTNLRRLLGDAQSQAAYVGIARELDTAARGLGYKGASPEELIAFAEGLRRLYPDTIPATSFSGGIVTGLGDAVAKVLDTGKPGMLDQQRALRALIDEVSSP